MDQWVPRVSAWLRRARRRYLETRARLGGRAFFCRSLAGRSEVNLCVNSDLTVSCNCRDVDGSGRIGDLGRQSLAEVLSGPAARRFRRDLARGRLPTPLCSRCWDLRMIERPSAQRLAEEHRLPRFLKVENTSACNLRCASCPRRQIRRLRRKVSLSLSDVERIAVQMRDCGVKRLAYLNFGEPFLSRTIRRELEIIREIHPAVSIDVSTNALAIDSDDKREAALLVDDMQVSLDGISQEMAQKYQRGTDFARALRNMTDLVAYRDARGLSRPRIVWKYLLFHWTERRRHLLRAIEMARQAGVDEILFEPTVSPFYGIPIRYYLGLLRGVGSKTGGGFRVVLRPQQTTWTEPFDAGLGTECAAGEAVG
jgi:pyruvate-formate lyase-activating enzyme